MSFIKGNYKMGEIEIIKEVLIYCNKYLNIYNDEVIFPSGTKGTYFRIKSNDKESVAILPISDDGKIFLIKNYRHAARGWGYEVPKGGVANDETCEQAALRELLEETGLVSKKLINIGECFESPAVFTSKMHCYIALECEKNKLASQEDTEAIAELKKINIKDYIDGKCRLDFDDAITELMILKYLHINNMGDQNGE